MVTIAVRWLAAAGLCAALVFSAVVMARSNPAVAIVDGASETVSGDLTGDDLPTAVGGLGAGQGGGGGQPSTPGGR